MLRILTLCSLFVWTGCTSEDTCDPSLEDTGIQIGSIAEQCICSEPDFWMGSSTGEFIGLNDGDGVTMVYGPQGGWHIWGSVRAKNTRDVIKIHFRISDKESGVVVVDVTNQVALAMEDDCTGIYTGMYGFLDVLELSKGELDTPPELLCEHELELHMIVTDSGGRKMEKTMDVIALPDDVDVNNCVD